MKTLARFSLPLWLCLAVWLSSCTFDASSYDHAKCTDDTQCAAAGLECIDGFCQTRDAEGEVDPCSLCESAEVCCAGVCCAADACCGETCLEVQSDVENCGGCGLACGEDETCSAGQCLCGETLGDGGPACPSPETCCNGGCTNPLFDSGCCGAEKAACLPDQICYSGTCECSPGQFACAGSTGCDVDIFSDPLHCRYCTTACDPAANPACIGGTCSCAGTPCTEGTQECCSASGTQFCIDTQDYLTNASHCGGCGKACVPNEVCVGGTCRCHSSTTPCAAGKTCCADGSCQASCECGNTPDCAFTCCSGAPDTCVDLTQDLDNCGGCGVACQDPQHTCVGGACICPAGLFNCEGGTVCVDVRSSTTHCGTCGNSCGAGEVCCGGNCIDTDTDKANCGGCGSVCNGDSCNNGQCACGGNPVDLGTNASHCGQCYNSCTLPHATVACVGGTCDTANATCSTGYANCNNDMSDGCEAHLSDDGNNCGACGASCTRPNVSSSCSSSSCSFGSCQSNFGDCNNSKATDGCEADLRITSNHCGSCSTDCAEANAVIACVSGSCNDAGAVCNPGWGNCDGNIGSNGCETNLTSTTTKCGICNIDCNVTNTTGEACVNSVCSYSGATCTSPYLNCDLNFANGCEVDKNTDEANCGTCANVCSFANAVAVCSTGTCVIESCTGTFEDCDNAASNGCETDVSATEFVGQCNCNGTTVDLQTDPDNCGGCGIVCSVSNASNELCTNGLCDYSAIVCDTLWGNCDGNGSNGCDVNLSNNNSACGLCAFSCSNGSDCRTAGYCRCNDGEGEACAVGADCDSDDNCKCNNSATGDSCRQDQGDHCEGNTCKCGDRSACTGNNNNDCSVNSSGVGTCS